MPWLKRSLPLLTSLLIGLIGAIIFSYLKTPLPWLLGAIVAIAIASRFEALSLRSPKMFSAPARAVLGITIGSAFHPDILKLFG
ncbi:AbrB family transcriptional regulator [Sulfurospirillum diekertiae]|uniref:AbrB family transcriptional regulator n=1 Tax=Sulfurospirillum diekertiae TaxID=1854492 RepID=UPI001374803B|nr:AbrB family transcriptional regulator [Sulfurospirillum diekertiae]